MQGLAVLGGDCAEKMQEYGCCVVPYKGPCTYVVYAWARRLLYGNPFKAQV